MITEDFLENFASYLYACYLVLIIGFDVILHPFVDKFLFPNCESEDDPDKVVMPPEFRVCRVIQDVPDVIVIEYTLFFNVFFGQDFFRRVFQVLFEL